MRPVADWSYLADAHASRTSHTSEVTLDERTATDLNLDAVFYQIDRTTSTLGQQALFHRLRTRGSLEELEGFEALVTHFSVDAVARERARSALTGLQDPRGYDLWWLGSPDAVTSRAWHALFPLLAAVTLMVSLATVVWHVVWPLMVAAVIVVLGVRLLVAKDVSDSGLALRQVAPVVAAGERLVFLSEQRHSGLDALPADVAALRRLKTIARWLSGDPLMLSFRMSGPAMLASAIAGVIYEYLNLILLLDANGVFFGSEDLRRHGSALLRVVRIIGDVDAALSVADWRAERADWTRPVFAPRGSVASMVDLQHPLVQDAVPNTVTLTPGRGALVSGSNMSGKSTFLRTVGVNVVLAQTVHTCLARQYDAPVLSVRSCIGRADDILSGKSYYLAEVESVLALVDAAASDAPHLFLFDELFRGTNTVERIAAAEAVLTTLLVTVHGPRSHVTIAATHDGELAELLRSTYDTYHFRDRMTPSGLEFDFLLQPGLATTRNAIALLAQRGAPAGLVDRALASAERLDARRTSAS